MIRKLNSPIPGHVRVVFELPSGIWADRIFLAGDFNGWDESAIPLRQDRDGVWQAMLDLPAGSRHQFRYLIDGQWSTDYRADGCTKSAFGAENSILHAELPQVSVIAARAEAPAVTGTRQRTNSRVKGQSSRRRDLRAAA